MPRENWFDLTRGGVASDNAENLRWLRSFLLLHVAARNFILLPTIRAEEPIWVYWVSMALIVCSAVAMVPSAPRFVTWGAAAFAAVHVAGTLPQTANHTFIEALCLGFVALLDQNVSGERDLLLKALRWMTLIFFFYSGLQKVMHGYYFDGQFLSFVTAEQENFSLVFRHIIPAAELVRLKSLSATELGMGPYRAESALVVLISNAVYLFELAIPVLLLRTKTRTAAAVMAMVFVVGIELGARELFFGTLTISLLTLFLPGRATPKVCAFFACAYLYLVLHHLRLVPFVYYWI